MSSGSLAIRYFAHNRFLQKSIIFLPLGENDGVNLVVGGEEFRALMSRIITQKPIYALLLPIYQLLGEIYYSNSRDRVVSTNNVQISIVNQLLSSTSSQGSARVCSLKSHYI